MKKFHWIVALSVLIIASLACGAFSKGSNGGSGGSGDSGSPGGSGSSGGSGSNSGAHDTKFPLPSSVSNFTDMGNGSINFQTDLSITDTIAFYRAAFGKQGLTERTINTSITDTTFSMVFDGDPSGQAVVIQGVDLGGGKTNVNIRFEKV
jgi:hypothetical protein